MSPGMFRSAAILGLLSCVGPFAIDMYLPAMPLIEQDLATDVSHVQATITAFFVAFGVSQLVYGPWADQAGRKPPLYTGLTLFAVATVACALAPTIGWLTAARFVQGLGAAVVMVIPRAIIRDMHTGSEATRLMALIMLVISVSPMLAPLLGSVLILLAGWRVIFVALGIATILSLLMTVFLQPETLAPEHRVRVNTRSLLKGCRTLVTDPVFMGLTFIGGFGMASFFVFIASASFVYTGQFGLTPVEFSLAFAVNAIGFFGASQFAAHLGEKFGAIAVMRAAIFGFFLFNALLVSLVLSGLGTLIVLIALLFCGNACLGLVIPTTMVMALDPHGEIAGLASSLGGTLQMLSGGLVITATSPFFDATATPMVIAIFVCSVAALLLTLALQNRVKDTAINFLSEP